MAHGLTPFAETRRANTLSLQRTDPNRRITPTGGMPNWPQWPKWCLSGLSGLSGAQPRNNRGFQMGG